MWRVGFVALAACGFTPSSQGVGPGGDSGVDATPRDGRIVDGAAIDAEPIDAPSVACTVTGSGSSATTGQLGNPAQPADTPTTLACPDGELVVGFAFDLSTSTPPGGWNEPVVLVTHLRCARFDLLANHAIAETMDATSMPVGAAANACGWPDANAGSEVDCPTGSVVTGLTGDEAQNGGTKSLFEDIKMKCTAIAADGTASGSAVSKGFSDTGTGTSHPQSASCSKGAAIVGFVSEIGCGQDSLIPQCAAVVCP